MIALACVLYGLLLCVVRTALLPGLGLSGSGPDLLLPVVVFLGFSRPLASGLAASLALGWLADLFAGAGAGVHLFGYACAFAACRVGATHLLLRGALLTALLTALTSLAQEGALATFAQVAGIGLPPPSGGALTRAVLDGAFAPLVLHPVKALERAVQGRREPWRLPRSL